MESHSAWAARVFGSLELGDRRRTARVVSLATAAAERPGGHVTSVCRSAAEQEAAYRLLERGRVDVVELGRGVWKATAEECAKHPTIRVAVDQTTVTVADRMRAKTIGRVRHPNALCQGQQVMSGLALDDQGVPLGLLAQCWWRRADDRSLPWEQDRRPLEQRESVLWTHALTQSLDSLHKEAPNCRPWFQLDRAADANHVIRWLKAHRHRADVTVRGAYERRLLGGSKLRKTVRKGRVKGWAYVHVPESRGAGRQRPARCVRCSVRYAEVTLDLGRHGAPEPVTLHVVHVREPRPRAKRLEWWLLTTREVSSLDDALTVTRAYGHRWRIEELHRTWKSGACDVESSQLRTAKPLKIWATLLSAVAARIERLKHLSRTEPDLPAHVELTQDEVDAAIVLTRTKEHAMGDELTLGQAVALIAQVGGYARRKHPPGSQVLSRGFDRVLAAATALDAARSG